MLQLKGCRDYCSIECDKRATNEAGGGINDKDEGGWAQAVVN